MTTLKSKFYCPLGTDSEMEFQGDPLIYSSANTLELGVSSTIAPEKKKIAATIAQITKSTGASLLKCTCTNGTGDDQESRVVRVVCAAAKRDSAPTGMIGKTFSLGNTTTKVWTVRAAKF